MLIGHRQRVVLLFATIVFLGTLTQTANADALRDFYQQQLFEKMVVHYNNWTKYGLSKSTGEAFTKRNDTTIGTFAQATPGGNSVVSWPSSHDYYHRTGNGIGINGTNRRSVDAGGKDFRDRLSDEVATLLSRAPDAAAEAAINSVNTSDFNVDWGTGVRSAFESYAATHNIGFGLNSTDHTNRAFEASREDAVAVIDTAVAEGGGIYADALQRFEGLSGEYQKSLFNSLSDERTTSAFQSMALGDQASVFEDMTSSSEREELFSQLSADEQSSLFGAIGSDVQAEVLGNQSPENQTRLFLELDAEAQAAYFEGLDETAQDDLHDTLGVQLQRELRPITAGSFKAFATRNGGE